MTSIIYIYISEKFCYDIISSWPNFTYFFLGSEKNSWSFWSSFSSVSIVQIIWISVQHISENTFLFKIHFSHTIYSDHCFFSLYPSQSLSTSYSCLSLSLYITNRHTKQTKWPQTSLNLKQTNQLKTKETITHMHRHTKTQN